MNNSSTPPEKAKEEQWTSYSRKTVASASSTIHELLSRLGVEVHLGGNDNIFSQSAYIQSTSFNIRFEERNYGCELQVYIFKENRDSELFLAFWKMMINNGKLVWGGKYKKDLTVKSEDASESEAHQHKQEDNKETKEPEWQEKWIQIVCEANIPPDDKLKYIFLFAVLREHNEIRPKWVQSAREKDIPEIDRMAGTDKTFQELAKCYPAEYLKGQKIVAKERKCAKDLDCITASIYRTFYKDHKKDFEIGSYPDFSKAVS